MHWIGVDLSGPTNTADTAGFCFRSASGVAPVRRGRASRGGASPPNGFASASLECVGGGVGLADAEILALVAAVPAERGLIVALDAPLSYNPGGGDRPADRELRARLVRAGLRAGSVMAPTTTRMAYLTLRGISVAHAILRARPDAVVVETHPAGAMVLRGAPAEQVAEMKRSPSAREALVKWLGSRGLPGPPDVGGSDHGVAALACVLAARELERGRVVFDARADPPHHPFRFVC